jgi:hypothetical protein
MEKIPTAEEFFEKGGSYPELAIEFAKLHVTEALKEASKIAALEGKWGREKVSLQDINDHDQDGGWILVELNRKSILNAYSLENIK